MPRGGAASGLSWLLWLSHFAWVFSMTSCSSSDAGTVQASKNSRTVCSGGFSVIGCVGLLLATHGVRERIRPLGVISNLRLRHMGCQCASTGTETGTRQGSVTRPTPGSRRLRESRDDRRRHAGSSPPMRAASPRKTSDAVCERYRSASRRSCSGPHQPKARLRRYDEKHVTHAVYEAGGVPGPGQTMSTAMRPAGMRAPLAGTGGPFDER